MAALRGSTAPGHHSMRQGHQKMARDEPHRLRYSGVVGEAPGDVVFNHGGGRSFGLEQRLQNEHGVKRAWVRWAAGGSRSTTGTLVGTKAHGSERMVNRGGNLARLPWRIEKEGERGLAS
jgi:hypothetical protein